MHSGSFLSQGQAYFCSSALGLSEIVEGHSVSKGVRPGRTEELTPSQGQPSTLGDGNWWLNAHLWRDKSNTQSVWLLRDV